MKYIFTILIIMGSVISQAQTELSVVGTVLCRDKGISIANSRVLIVCSDGTDRDTKSDSLGQYAFKNLPIEHDFILVAEQEGYLTGRAQMSTKSVNEDSVFHVDVYLGRMTPYRSMPNLKFRHNNARLDSIHMKTLYDLKETLEDNPNLIIEVRGHCSNNEDTLMSLERANSVKKFLVSIGIPEDRLVASSFLMTEPQEVWGRDAEEYEGLREGEKLTKEYINILSLDLRKVAHMLNRRVDFRVLRDDYKRENK